MIDVLPDLLNSNSGSVLGAVLLVVYAAITSLRKRRDVTIAELEKRVASLEAKIDTMEAEHEQEVAELKGDLSNADSRVEGYKATNLQYRRDVFRLRQVLADNNLPDPTDRRDTAV